MTRWRAFTAVALTAFLAAACAGEPEGAGEEMTSEQQETGEQMSRSVEIVSPADGDTVEGPQVTVQLAAQGFQVVPAGDTTANSGHHHLFLDRDVSAPDQPIPTEQGQIVHMGDGSSSFTFENVQPGEHRLIAVVGDAIHVPVEGLQDTVNFTVR